ncbi:polysaccharide pyruvyl transferase family protein [Weeksellaceae bacterium TAE3-ERU29]|nr:polysaccharide pyruvyl transferase family protein [Weeksellaceae bacterium TAE3-ERU29]
MLKKDKKKAFIFLAADYGNLGDVAITYAQTKFIKENSDFQVIEIPISKSLEGLWFVKKNICPGDIITTVGGGNMGDVYEQIEHIRQIIVKFFPRNKIISFPQTIDFSKNVQGQKALKQAQKVYSKHTNLILVAREKKSYNLMENFFPNNEVLLCPDIVLYLNKTKPIKDRKGAIFCLRNDEEKALSKEQNEYIINTIEGKYSMSHFYDTHIKKDNLSISERNQELNNIWGKFKSSEVVITDRLHGMIFCYITNTPCIVFKNNNHKINETYNWIKDHSKILFIDDFSIMDLDKTISDLEKKKIEYVSLNKEYTNLLKVLK